MTPARPLTPEEEAEVRWQHETRSDRPSHESLCTSCRLLATLDAARQPTDNPADNGLLRVRADIESRLEHGLRHIPGATKREERHYNDGQAFGLRYAIERIDAALATTPSLPVAVEDLDWLMLLVIDRATNEQYHRAKDILIRLGAKHPGITTPESRRKALAATPSSSQAAGPPTDWYSDASAAIEALPAVAPGAVDRETVLGILRSCLASQAAGLDAADAGTWRAAEAEGHVVDFTDDSYGLQHPPSCRPDLIGCRVNQYLASRGYPEEDPGRYRITLHKGHAEYARLADDADTGGTGR